MFLDYYKLAEQPFGVTPDARFLYKGPNHREALASLVYGTENDRGFLAMIAESGMGKTTLLYNYLAHYGVKARTAFVFRTNCDSREFIQQILLDLNTNISGMDLPMMYDVFNRLVNEEAQAGRRFVLVIDEAQNLDEKTLESIRLLSNFEGSRTKPIIIVLAGQPKFAQRLAKPSLSQLRQRISMVIRLEPFTPEEVNAYIDYRLMVAGSKNISLFSSAARTLIAEHSRGIPRNINNLCFNAMSLGHALRLKTINRDVISEVIADLDLAISKGSAKASADIDPGTLTKKGNLIADLNNAVLGSRSADDVSINSMPLKDESRIFSDVSTAVVSMDDEVSQKGANQAPEMIPDSYKRGFICGGWLSKFVVAGTLSLVLVSSAGLVDRSKSLVIPVKALGKRPPEQVADSEKPTLKFYDICVEKFGRYNCEVLGNLFRLNLWSHKWRGIAPDQKSLISSPPLTPAPVQGTDDEGRSASKVGKEKR